jgi:hypothetical protein
MRDGDRVRWLLRPLGEPAFLRLYVETDIDGRGALPPRYPRRLFEDTFWALPADLEHPKDAQDRAWRSLKEWLPEGEHTALEWYATLVRCLCEPEHNIASTVRDLAQFWAAPELFLKTEGAPELFSETKGAPCPEPAGVNGSNLDYYELHCHLRGAVPFSQLWHDAITNDRARARLRKDRCQVGLWERTWAELAQEAAAALKRRLALGSRPALAPHEEACACERLRAAGGDGLQILRELVAELSQDRPWCEGRQAAARYLAIYTAARRHFLYQRGKAGLVRFTEAYKRYSGLQQSRGRHAFDPTQRDVTAIFRRFREEGASAVELRPTLETSRRRFQDKLRSVVLGYFEYVRTCGDNEPLVMGLVPSLYKQQECDQREDDGTGRVWEKQAEVWHRQLDILFAILDETPALRFFVVGVDAAGRERGCPPRVLAPLMRRVLDYGRKRGVGGARPGRAMSPSWLRQIAQEGDCLGRGRGAFDTLNKSSVSYVRLGRTVHAGEDFVDPMTGLRHIWETLEACDFGPGDRLGHALAAGLHPEDVRALLDRRVKEVGEISVSKESRPGWQLRKPHGERWQLRKPRGEHALDLAWLAQMHDGDNRARWRAELAGLSGSLLGVPSDADRLAGVLGTDLRLPMVPGARYCDPTRVADPDCTWHAVDDAWLQVFERMRQRVLDEIVRRRVVVESCPSSNLAVAGLRRPPLLRFLADGVRCAVATDDPGLLDAWPSRELAYVRCQACDEGKGCDECRRKRERVLDQNRAASFVTRSTSTR